MQQHQLVHEVLPIAAFRQSKVAHLQMKAQWNVHRAIISSSHSHRVKYVYNAELQRQSLKCTIHASGQIADMLRTLAGCA